MNAYPSPGRILYRGVYTGVNSQPEPVWTSMRHAQPLITNGQFSMPEAIDDASQWRIRIKFATAPTTATTLQFSDDPSFTTNITFTTIPPNATDTLAFFSTAQNVAYNAIMRVSNTSDATINEVRVQKIVTGGGNAKGV